ncbi:MAG: MBL fold metallo-hydrolase [Deltaproteobacteria bacterium]|nr:MBL fold metallo-hydrolase [Deltaproteobacteria bacterium]
MRIDVLTSGIWQTTSTIIEVDGACLVIDPAYFPRELEAIAAHTAELGRIEAVVFTHGHWDHVMGHTAFDAPVWVSQTLEHSIITGHPRAAKYLEDARDFDSRWYVPRPRGHAWPLARRALADEEHLALGRELIRVLQLPGHSPDGLGLVAGDTLLVGDYLSPCEIPFVDNLDAYLVTLRRLIEVIEHGVREVIPGHGPRLTRAEAVAIARADLAYLERLLADGDAPLPRAADVIGMRDHHLENLAKLRSG